MAKSETQAEVMKEIRPKIERSCESSRLEGEYETVVPIPRTLSSRNVLERLQNMAAAIPTGHQTPVLSAQG